MAIELNGALPIPKQQRKVNPRESKYPFSSLAVGEAFTVSGETLPKGGASSVRASVSNYRRANPMSDTHRFKVLPNEDGTVTVWRVK